MFWGLFSWSNNEDAKTGLGGGAQTTQREVSGYLSNDNDLDLSCDKRVRLFGCFCALETGIDRESIAIRVRTLMFS